MSGRDLAETSPQRKYLHAAVTALCYEAGFTSAQNSTLETLTEMLQSLLTELGRNSKSYCELTGRTEVLGDDVLMAMTNMGLDVESLSAYAKRPNRISLPTPISEPQTSTPSTLQVGEKRPLPDYVPEYFPPFPDPHTYVRTYPVKQRVTDYAAIRERAACQKRDSQASLIGFKTRTSSTHSFFPDDVDLFPLLASKPTARPYSSALLFKDQVFDENESGQITGELKSHSQGLEDSDTENNVNKDFDIMSNPYLRQQRLPGVDHTPLSDKPDSTRTNSLNESTKYYSMNRSDRVSLTKDNYSNYGGTSTVCNDVPGKLSYFSAQVDTHPNENRTCRNEKQRMDNSALDNGVGRTHAHSNERHDLLKSSVTHGKRKNKKKKVPLIRKLAHSETVSPVSNAEENMFSVSLPSISQKQELQIYHVDNISTAAKEMERSLMKRKPMKSARLVNSRKTSKAPAEVKHSKNGSTTSNLLRSESTRPVDPVKENNAFLSMPSISEMGFSENLSKQENVKHFNSGSTASNLLRAESACPVDSVKENNVSLSMPSMNEMTGFLENLPKQKHFRKPAHLSGTHRSADGVHEFLNFKEVSAPSNLADDKDSVCSAGSVERNNVILSMPSFNDMTGFLESPSKKHRAMNSAHLSVTNKFSNAVHDIRHFKKGSTPSNSAGDDNVGTGPSFNKDIFVASPTSVTDKNDSTSVRAKHYETSSCEGVENSTHQRYPYSEFSHTKRPLSLTKGSVWSTAVQTSGSCQGAEIGSHDDNGVSRKKRKV